MEIKKLSSELSKVVLYFDSTFNLKDVLGYCNSILDTFIHNGNVPKSVSPDYNNQRLLFHYKNYALYFDLKVCEVISKTIKNNEEGLLIGNPEI